VALQLQLEGWRVCGTNVQVGLVCAVDCCAVVLGMAKYPHLKVVNFRGNVQVGVRYCTLRHLKRHVLL
jgi:hypothetical protein